MNFELIMSAPDAEELPRFTSRRSLPLFVADLRCWVFGSQSRAARSLGLSYATISRYERGSMRPAPGYLASLARLVVERLPAEAALAARYRHALLDEINKALRVCYPDSPPFASWEALCEAARMWRS